MTNIVSQVFDAHADAYDGDGLRRRLIPPFDAFYGTAVAALEIARPAPRRILDLGAGTGLFAGMVADAHPEAELVLLDAATAMLAEARDALGDRASYVEGDLTHALPNGPWDAIVSALAIHHLDDPAKRDLYARIHDALAPGGVFVNAEQVAGASAFFDEHSRAWHQEACTAVGATPEEWAGAEARMAFDRCASVEHQLAWLREGGFADAECLFKDHRFAVLAARRAG
jgi:tRNA (cmo5U34)-methyltransferase